MPTFVHRNVTDTSATIRVPGLQAPLKVLHLSDSHVDVGAEKGREEDMRFMHGVYSQGAQDRSSGAVTIAADALASSLERGRTANVDLLCHTGDLVNFPSPMAVQQVQDLLGAAGFGDADSAFYISGNHDWEYGQPPEFEEDETGQVVASAGAWQFLDEPRLGSVEAVRADAWNGALQQLYGTRSPDAWVENKGGLLFVGIDNTTYTISPSQHAVLKEALAAVRDGNAQGVVLLIHVPLYTPELYASMLAGGRDVKDALCGNPDATHHPPDAETRAFLATVFEAPELVAVLCGHIHAAQSIRLRGEWKRERPGERVPYPCHGSMMYVVDAGCYGGYRLITFEPSEDHEHLDPGHDKAAGTSPKASVSKL